MNAAFIEEKDGPGDASVTSRVPLARRVDVAEFRRLAVSHRRMIRADDPKAGLHGLRDLDTGELFLVETFRLAAK